MSDFVSTVELDDAFVKEFGEALDRYADYRTSDSGKGTGRSYPYVLNRVTKDVAIRAAVNTRRADKGELQTLLSDPAVAARILSARLRNKGKQRPNKAAWATMVKYFMDHTPKTASFMAAGWLAPFRMLNALVRESSGDSPRTAFGRSTDELKTKRNYPAQLGYAIPAHDVGEGLAVEIGNQSINPNNPTSEKALHEYGEAALEAALASKAQDMELWLDEVQSGRAEEFNRK